MSTAAAVPETRGLEGDDAVETLKDVGVAQLVRDSFVRFRRADAFSHSRALAFQLVLTLLPALIAVVGFAGSSTRSRSAGSWRSTFKDLAPGPAGEVLTQTIKSGSGGGGVALVPRPRDRDRLGRHRDGPDRARREPDLRRRARPAERRQVHASDPARAHRPASRPSARSSWSWRARSWAARSPTTAGATPWERSGRSAAGRSARCWSSAPQHSSSRRLPTAPARAELARLRLGPLRPLVVRVHRHPRRLPRDLEGLRRDLRPARRLHRPDAVGAPDRAGALFAGLAVAAQLEAIRAGKPEPDDGSS